MNDIAIGISVDTAKLVDAKKMILDLGKTLEDVSRHSSPSSGLNAKTEVSDLVNEMMAAMRKIETINFNAGKNGGLKIGQSDTANSLLDKFKKDAAVYDHVLGDIGKSLDALYEKKRKLESIPFTASTWEKAQEELKAVNREYSEKVSGYEKMQTRFDTRVDHARARVGQSEREIDAQQTLPSGGGLGGLGLGKILGGAATVFGGFSFLSFLNQSRQEFRRMSDLEATMATRGIGFERGLSPYGFTPLDEADTAMALHKVTGYKGMASARAMERFARSAGVDVGTGIGFAGNAYSYSGMGPEKEGRLMDVLVSLKEGSKDRRIEEILKIINTNLGAVFGAQGGKALSDSQIGNVLATTMSMYNRGGTMGNSSDLFNTMQGGLRMGGGDTAAELMKWQVMGGFEGPMTASKMIEMQRMQDQGLNDPQMRSRAMAMIAKMPGRANQNLALQRMLFGGFNKQGGANIADTILDLYGTGGVLTGAGDPTTQGRKYRDYISGKHLDPAIAKDVGRLVGAWLNTPGAKVQSRKAQADLLHLGAGEGLERAFGKFEDVALSTADDLLSSGFTKTAIDGIDRGGAAAIASTRGFHADPLIRDVAKRVGIDPEFLRAVVGNESGFNPKATSPKGARGLMQLMPETAKAYGVRDIYDPKQNLTAGAKYLKALLDKYEGDTGKALAGYNWGPGNVDRQGMASLPRETNDFIAHVNRDWSGRRSEAPKEAAPIIGTEDGSFLGYIGLFREMVASLQKIAANTSLDSIVPHPLPGPPK